MSRGGPRDVRGPPLLRTRRRDLGRSSGRLGYRDEGLQASGGCANLMPGVTGVAPLVRDRAQESARTIGHDIAGQRGCRPSVNAALPPS